MKLGIVISTYQKPNGQTPTLLTRALNSIKSQTHQDYKVFLIGDKYNDEDEFIKLSTSIIDSDKIFYQNLPNALEREKYPLGSQQLWCSGGVNAINYGLKKCFKDGIEYVCHLDHDDYWGEEHLEIINKIIEDKNKPSFIYTCGTFHNTYLPNIPLISQPHPLSPVPCKTIHSSTCMNIFSIPLRYRDLFQEEGIIAPSDADLWGRISQYISDNNLSSYVYSQITCFHPTEGQ